MTKEEIIEIAKECIGHRTCDSCKFRNLNDGNDCNVVLANYILEQENEPAPAGTDTSSKNNSLSQFKNTPKQQNCQEADYKKKIY